MAAEAASTQKPVEIRNTKQRRAVAATLDTLEDFISAQDLHQLMLTRGQSVSLATTYRILQSMVTTGEVESLKTAEGEAIYRRCDSDHHHHHLLCRLCGAAEEFEVPQLEDWAHEVAERYGYSDISHVIEVTGICTSCSAQA